MNTASITSLEIQIGSRCWLELILPILSFSYFMLLHVLESMVLELMHDGSGRVSGKHRLTTHPCTSIAKHCF